MQNKSPPPSPQKRKEKKTSFSANTRHPNATQLLMSFLIAFTVIGTYVLNLNFFKSIFSKSNYLAKFQVI